jgi:hypothetical protein
LGDVQTQVVDSGLDLLEILNDSEQMASQVRKSRVGCGDFRVFQRILCEPAAENFPVIQIEP